jgi:hypothetical protein
MKLLVEGDLAAAKREAIIKQLAFDALTAVYSLDHPKIRPPTNDPRVLKILKLAGEYYRGERTPSPYVQAMARRILDNAQRINNSSRS